MRRSSTQKMADSPEIISRGEERQKKISNASSVSIKHRKISTDHSSSFEKMPQKNTGRKESLKSVCVIPKYPKQNLPEKEYEPFDHRDVKHPNTFFETLMNLFKGSMGTGILAMPYAFSNAGYVAGTLGTLTIGFICTYSVHILMASSYELCKRNKKPNLRYPEIAEMAIAGGPEQTRGFAKIASNACNFFLLVYEIGSAAIYIVFISTNLKDVIDQYQPTENQWDVRWYCLCILVPLILLNSIRSYKYLAPLAAFATVLTILSFAIIFYYLFSELPDVSNRLAVAPVNKLALYFGTVIFAMEAIGVVIPLESEMGNPKKFRGVFGVLNCAMVPITLLYTSVGLFGYLRYGEDVKGSITLSLPPHSILSQAVRVMLSVAIFFTHALLLHPAIDIIWIDFVKPKVHSKQLFWEYVIRISTVILTFFLAVAVPFLELFISLIGALCLSMVGLFFPAMIQTFTYWHDLNGVPFLIFFLKNACICIMATYGLAFGVKTSVEGMIEKMCS